ncbi:hypothetical protein ACWPKO_29240 (plasmid) [Coraliomargarita sp. W4R53]
MRVRAAVVGVVLGVSALALSGCANPIDQLVQGGIQEGIEQVVEEATGGDVDIDVDGGGNASLPDSFPSDVPVPSGSLISSFAMAGTYQLTYSGGSSDGAKNFVDSLVADGYEIVTESDMGEMQIWILNNDQWTLSVSTLEAEGEEPYLAYTVSPLEQ